MIAPGTRSLAPGLQSTRERRRTARRPRPRAPAVTRGEGVDETLSMADGAGRGVRAPRRVWRELVVVEVVGLVYGHHGRQRDQGDGQARRRQRERVDLAMPVQPVQPRRDPRLVRLDI